MRSRGLRAAALATLLAAASPCGAARPAVGVPAPPFTAELLGGDRIKLADLRGQVVILNFWATWCPPCREELPLLEGYYRINGRHGLRILAVLTRDSVPLRRLTKLTDQLTLSVVTRLDGPGYKILEGVPTNYIIDRQGVLRYAKADALSLDELNAILVPLLNEPPPAPPPQP